MKYDNNRYMGIYFPYKNKFVRQAIAIWVDKV